MLSTINKLTHETRKNFVPWLDEHQNLRKFLSGLYAHYTDITGSAHLLPDFLIIGAKKCGTTSLYRNLTKHPFIEPNLIKEPNFFNRYYEKGLNWYRCCFPFKFYKTIAKSLNRQLVTGEATPTYIYHPYVPKRVKAILPDVKLIIILRNPIDRAYSHYTMEVHHGKETLSFEEAIEQEEKRISGELEKMKIDESYFSLPFHTFSYLGSGRYAEQINNWLKYFPRNQFLILRTEDFNANPHNTLDKTIEFLGLPKKKIKYERFKTRQYTSTMNPTTRKKLIDYFKPHNEQLHKLLDMDFDWDK